MSSSDSTNSNPAAASGTDSNSGGRNDGDAPVSPRGSTTGLEAAGANTPSSSANSNSSSLDTADGTTTSGSSGSKASDGNNETKNNNNNNDAAAAAAAAGEQAGFHDQRAPPRRHKKYEKKGHKIDGEGEGGAAGVEADLAITAEEQKLRKKQASSKKPDGADGSGGAVTAAVPHIAATAAELGQAAAAATAAAAAAAAALDGGSDVDDINIWREEKIAQAPCLLRPLYSHFVSAVRPDDSFDVAVRKMLLAGTVIVLPFPLGFGTYWIVVAATADIAADHSATAASDGHIVIDTRARISLIVAGATCMLVVLTIIIANAVNRFVYYIDDRELTAARALLEDAGDIEMFDEEYKQRRFLARQQRQQALQRQQQAAAAAAKAQKAAAAAVAAEKNGNNNNNNNNNNSSSATEVEMIEHSAQKGDTPSPRTNSNSSDGAVVTVNGKQQNNDEGRQLLNSRKLADGGGPETPTDDHQEDNNSNASATDEDDLNPQQQEDVASAAAYPFWITDLIITVAVLFVCLLSVSIPHFPVPTNMLAVVQMSVVVRSDWFMLHAALASLGFLVATYNMTFLNYEDWPLLAISEYHGTPAENLLLTLQGWAAILITSYSLYVHYSEFLRLVHKSSTTTQMGSSVATHLRQWDLKGVERALTSYHAQPNSDNFLHTQFTHIVQTIRDFSVYLPRDIISSLVQAGESLRDSRLRMRDVTLVWIEIANFPALCDTVPCEELAKLLRWFHEAMARVVRQHDGVVVRLGGNMLCGMWNAPQRHENAASRACMAALHAVSVAEDALLSKFEDEGFGLQIRVGVHSGTAMVGPLGSCDRASFTANGGAVHFSAAMAKFGKRMRRSSIMVSDATLHDANTELEAIGPLARFVAREAAEARAARHTTTTLVHQLIGITPDTAPLLKVESNKRLLAQQQQQLAATSGASSGENTTTTNMSSSIMPENQQQARRPTLSPAESETSLDTFNANGGDTTPGGQDTTAVAVPSQDGTGEQQQQQRQGGKKNSSSNNSNVAIHSMSVDSAHSPSVDSITSSSENAVIHPPLFAPDVVHKFCCVDDTAAAILDAMDRARRMFDHRDFAGAYAVYLTIPTLYDPAPARGSQSQNLPAPSSSGSSEALGSGSGGGSTGSLGSSQTSTGPGQQQQYGGGWPAVLATHGVDEQLVAGLSKAAQRLSVSNKSSTRFEPIVVFYDE